MHRLPADSATLNMECAILTKESAAHLKVLRPKDGEEFELFDGRGSTRTYAWHAADKALVAAAPKSTVQRKRSCKISLFACVTKGQRWDWTLQKATELGVAKIFPVISERTIVRIGAGDGASKKARWQKICEEAARQSDAIWLPEISEPLGFAAALDEAAATTCFAGAIATPPPEPLLSAVTRSLANGTRGAFSVFVGPEGDFTQDELSSLLRVATPASFGPTILRAETAAIFAVGVLAAAIDAATR